jgi:hypothetical protein
MIAERLRLFRTIPHYLTNQPNSKNAGALVVGVTGLEPVTSSL